MDSVQLETLSRTQFGTPAAQKARAAGQYPATVVGGGKPTVQVTVDARAFDTALRHQARGFTLTGAGENERVALHELQYDALGDAIQQIDFLRDPDGSRAAQLAPE